MNERIKELIEQATEHDYKTYDYFNQKELVHNKFNKEKFAELIVLECLELVDKVESMFEDDKEKRAAAWIGLGIAKHFGVE